MQPLIVIVGQSDVGQVRKRNEDSFAVLPDLGIAVVADGMGGHPGGDVASRIAADTAARELADAVEEGARGEEEADFAERFVEVMRAAVLRAHDAIRERAAAEPRLDGMGTTLTAMVVDPTSGAWVIGHVGDSRVYRFRNGELRQLTKDDTWVQERIDCGEMQPESAKLSPYAHLLTQCLGLEEEPTPQLLHGRGERGESYLLCTDGLVGMLDDDRVAEILANGAPHEGASTDTAVPMTKLIEEANEAGGHDNITTALVRFG